MVAFLMMAFLAQVGVGIDRPPATPPAALRAAQKAPAKRPAAPKRSVPEKRAAVSTPRPEVRPSASPAAGPARTANLCSHAADVAIDSATEEKTDSAAGTDNFVIHVSILNRGSASQGTGAKQLISVYRNEERITRMQIPSLEAGEAYAFTTKFKRSSEAGANSTTLLFRLGGENYAPRSIEDCNDRNNSYRLTF